MTRRLIPVEGLPTLVIWRQAGDRVDAAVAGSRYLQSLGGEAVPGGGLRWAITDPEGRTVLGESADSNPAVERELAG